MTAIARRLSPGPAMRRMAVSTGLTEGQAYTLVIGLVLALVTAMIGIPPTLRDDVVQRVAQLPAQLAEKGGAPSPAEVAPSLAVPTEQALAATPFTSPSFMPSPSSSPDPEPLSGSSGPETVPFADGGAPGTVERVSEVDQEGAPTGIAVADDGGFVVADDDRVVRYSPAGAVVRTFRIAGQPDGRVRGLTGIAVVDGGQIVAVDASTSRVLRLDLATGSVAVLATVPDVPPCAADRGRCELSPRNGPPILQAVAVDAAGATFIADGGQGIIWRMDRFGDLAVWDRAPELLAADGTGPGGMAFEATGDLVVTVGTSVVALTGSVYRIAVDGTGAAGGHDEIYRSEPRAVPTGIAVAGGGRLVVTLAGSDRVVVLAPDGTVGQTVTSPELKGPTGVAVRGGSVLVTNRRGASVVRIAL